MLYNVTTMATIWHTVAVQDTRLLRKQMDIVYGLPKSYTFLNYLRCHDDIGWGLDYDTLESWGMKQVPHKQYLNDFFTGVLEESFSRGELYNNDPVTKDARFCGTAASMCGVEKAGFCQDEAGMEQAIRLDRMLHAYMLFQSGIPVIYSGDEIGQVNDYTYKEDPDKAEDSRYIHRGQFKWELVENIEKEGTVQQRMFDGLRKLETLRSCHEAFGSEAQVQTVDFGDNGLLGIVRTGETEKIQGIFNFNWQEKRVFCEHGGQNLLTGEKVEAGEWILIPAYGFVWLKVPVE